MKGNRELPNNHFRKTSLKIKVHHDPEGKTRRMQLKKVNKAKGCFPMPSQKLRPIVRCSSLRFNRNERLGRGFTAEECKRAGLEYQHARRLGIAVDLRRRDSNQETLDKNIERIKTYLGKITIHESFEDAMKSGAKPYSKTIMPLVKAEYIVPAISEKDIASYE